MLIILQYTWPLIASLIGGFIIGILFVKIFSQKIKFLKKLSSSGPIIISVIVGIVVGISIIEFGNNLARRLFHRNVVVVEDIDLEKDYYLNRGKGEVKGIIKKGSLATQTFSKGHAVYLTFGAVVDRKHIKSAE